MTRDMCARNVCMACAVVEVPLKGSRNERANSQRRHYKRALGPSPKPLVVWWFRPTIGYWFVVKKAIRGRNHKGITYLASWWS